MSEQDIIRAWRDPEYRLSLSETELSFIPPHPAGVSETQVDSEGIPISPFSIVYSCYWICNL